MINFSDPDILKKIDWKNYNPQEQMASVLNASNFAEEFNMAIQGLDPEKDIYLREEDLEYFKDPKNHYSLLNELFNISQSIKLISGTKSLKDKQDSLNHIKSIKGTTQGLIKKLKCKDFEEINNELLGIDHENYQSSSDYEYQLAWRQVEFFLSRVMSDLVKNSANDNHAIPIADILKRYLGEHLKCSLENVPSLLKTMNDRASILNKEITTAQSRKISLTLSNKLYDSYRTGNFTEKIIYPKRMIEKGSHIAFFVMNLIPFIKTGTTPKVVDAIVRYAFRNDTFLNDPQREPDYLIKIIKEKIVQKPKMKIKK